MSKRSGGDPPPPKKPQKTTNSGQGNAGKRPGGPNTGEQGKRGRPAK